MSELRYKNPPLKMAGITFIYPEGHLDIERVASLLSPFYPRRSEGEHAKLSLSEQGWEELALFARQNHIRLESTDRREALIITPHSIAFRRHTPYGRWVDFRDNALRVLEYLSPLKLGDTERIQLRYVNHFDFPRTATLSWEEYFHVVPRWPELETGSHALAGMAQCVLSYDEEPKTFLRYTFRTIDEWTGDGLKFLLDLEGMSPGPLDLEVLEVNHRRIETFFVSALTDKTHEAHGRYYSDTEQR